MNWKYRAGAVLLALAVTLSLIPSALAAPLEPSMSLSPDPLKIQEGGSGEVTVTLKNVTESLRVDFSISGNASVAALDSASVTIPAGQSTASVKVNGLKEGSTYIVATAACQGKTLSDLIKVDVEKADTSTRVVLTADSEVEAEKPLEIAIELISSDNDTIRSISWNNGQVQNGPISGNRATATFTTSQPNVYDLTPTVVTAKGKTIKDQSIRVRVTPKVTPPPEDIAAVGIFMNQSSPQYINRSSTLILTAATTPSNATDPVIWEIVSGEDVVRLVPDERNDRRCTVEGLATGAATIIAKAGSVRTDNFVVEVSGLLLDPASLELFENGDAGTLTANRYGAARSMQLIWESQSEPIATVSNNGKVFPNSVGTAKIIVSAGSNYRAECTVTVKENVAGMIERSVSGGASYNLSGVVSDLRSRCTEMTKDSLKLIRGITVDPGAGILHYNYTSPEYQGQGVGSEAYYASPASSLERSISGITFVPKNGFSGNADIRYTGESAEGKNFNGLIRIKVTSTGDVTYSTASNLPVVFRTEEFNAICRPKTGQEIRYISFQQPSSGKGTLYRTYSAAAQYNAPVASSDKFYRTSNPRLDAVTFLPGENYTGTVKIPYLCVTTSGGSYTGTVTINVYSASSAGGRGDVNYSVAPDSHVTLQSADFNNACREATGSTLDYVYFDLPAASQGTLYLNYRSASSTGSRVSQDTRYYRSSSPRISNITFVPAAGFTGSVSVPFTAFDRSGESFKGTMVIEVTEDDGAIRYSTGENRPVTFDGQDFNEACQRVNGASLDYVTFETPPTSRGRLYRNYRSSSSTGSSVGDSTRLYYRGDPALSDVTFVPARNYNGTVSIPFSGYDSTGERFSGTVTVTVGTGSSSGDLVSYAVTSGGLVNFNASDFDNACQNITGERLSYVRFSLPETRYGTLYYQYNTSRNTGTSVTTSTSYYRTGGSRLLNDVSFLAASGVSGTASFDYTGWSTGGERFTGTVEIVISSPRSQVIRYATTGAQVAFQLSDFRNACSAALGGSLSYIRFSSLPSSGAGQVRLDGSAVSTGTSCYADSTPAISRLTFTPASGYWGTVSIGYTGFDTRGRSHNGTVEITVSGGTSTISAFTDLGGYSQEFVTAINALSSSGIVSGYGDGRFGPRQSVSRGAFALMVCRAFNLNTGGASSFPDVPADSVYAWAVATARDLGIAEGSNGRFNPSSPITRQAAMTMICRAMRAAGREVPNVSASAALTSFGDFEQISDYARASVASLVQMGAVRGDTSMRLNPTQSITRAQMAVILYRVLNLS